MNVPWPHKPRLNLLGPPHGFHGMNPEGTGPSGRCMAVLMGGRSGGHEAAVLNAAFHPTLPVLATCGVRDSLSLCARDYVDCANII